MCVGVLVEVVKCGLCFIGGSGGMCSQQMPESLQPNRVVQWQNYGDMERQPPNVPLPCFSEGDVRDYFRRVRMAQHANVWSEAVIL